MGLQLLLWGCSGVNTIVNRLVIDSYGPISDNVGGITDMFGFIHKIRERLDALDLTRNTTASFGKVRCSIFQLFFELDASMCYFTLYVVFP